MARILDSKAYVAQVYCIRELSNVEAPPEITLQLVPDGNISFAALTTSLMGEDVGMVRVIIDSLGPDYTAEYADSAWRAIANDTDRS